MHRSTRALTGILSALALFHLSAPLATAADKRHGLPRLKVSENQRFLVTESGEPFFYLGDTAWELFHRLNREEADHYLQTRAAQGYNVIQAVALAEYGGLVEPNPYGHLPLHGNDPARPNEKYFEHVDDIIDNAASLGLYTGLLPTWGDKVNKKWGMGPEIFTPDNARAFGRFLGRRYKDRPVIWILGGDRPIESEQHRLVFRAMAEGIREQVGDAQLITYHPSGWNSSSAYVHDEPWLDFNMVQSGHGTRVAANYKLVQRDHDRKPVKPTFDAEPNYENHPVNWKPELGKFDDHDVRRAAYWAVFAGGAGHTYGCNEVWQFFEPGKRAPAGHAHLPWREALELPGASQVRHLKALMLSRPYLDRVPDQSLLEDDHGDGADHCQATRDSAGRYAFVYTPTGKPLTVDLTKLAGGSIRASWYDPRTGQTTDAGRADRGPAHRFDPPSSGAKSDWVLILDAQE